MGGARRSEEGRVFESWGCETGREAQGEEQGKDQGRGVVVEFPSEMAKEKIIVL
jgi:hypothetical protein